ncbi:GAF domain-containing sensor histidine kinase [Streptomyces sp. NRRL F-5135]|uniref:GAF domain-containing sensor histidine kinase n=1 Tax=Streptomyces sp. NRRL F-5135 TaxID=1463858 RepID=UPI00068C1872|nr:GAF domain-containing protein [Streptomyces sp. NRRL F-5135]
MAEDRKTHREDLARCPTVLSDALRSHLDVVAHGSPEPARQLLESVLVIGRDLDLSHVLRRIVDAAVRVVDAEYGVLGILGEDGGLARVLHSGTLRTDAVARLPDGLATPGEPVRSAEPLWLTEPDEPTARSVRPAGHPASCRLRPERAPGHSLLGVPITVRGTVFGTLRLTGKRGGKGFGKQDEAVLSALAAAAGTAIEHARLYQEARDGRRWREADAEIVALLLSGADGTSVLRRIVDSARKILSADLGALAFPHEDGALRVALATGVDAESHQGLVIPREGSFAGAALRAGEPLISLDVEHDPRITVGPPRWAGLGPAVAMPMTAENEVRGVLLLARVHGGDPFTEAETAPLLSFAGHVALALELGERRRTTEKLTLLEDHERIARDLHDLAIQRLFATGMTLQSIVRFTEHPAARERLLRAVDDLDETIKIIRSAIFGLRTLRTSRTDRGLRARATVAVEQAASPLGFIPALRMEGLIDTDVPPDVAEHVLAVLQEALSNVARHARASAVRVSLTDRSGRLTLTVSDNGTGIPPDSRRSGLDNLARRAESLGGTLTTEVPEGGGTRVVWTVLLHSGGRR